MTGELQAGAACTIVYSVKSKRKQLLNKVNSFIVYSTVEEME